MSDPIKAYGWTAQPRDPKLFLSERCLSTAPFPVLVESVRLPDTPLANSVLAYAQEELNSGTFNHSMRVFYYGDTYTYWRILQAFTRSLIVFRITCIDRQSHPDATVPHLGSLG